MIKADARQAWEARERAVQKRAITQRAPLSQTIGGRAWTMGDESRRPVLTHSLITRYHYLACGWSGGEHLARTSENRDYPGMVIIIDCLSGYFHFYYYFTISAPVPKFQSFLCHRDVTWSIATKRILTCLRSAWDD